MSWWDIIIILFICFLISLPSLECKFHKDRNFTSLIAMSNILELCLEHSEYTGSHSQFLICLLFYIPSQKWLLHKAVIPGINWREYWECYFQLLLSLSQLLLLALLLDTDYLLRTFSPISGILLGVKGKDDLWHFFVIFIPCLQFEM